MTRPARGEERRGGERTRGEEEKRKRRGEERGGEEEKRRRGEEERGIILQVFRFDSSMLCPGSSSAL